MDWKDMVDSSMEDKVDMALAVPNTVLQFELGEWEMLDSSIAVAWELMEDKDQDTSHLEVVGSSKVATHVGLIDLCFLVVISSW